MVTFFLIEEIKISKKSNKSAYCVELVDDENVAKYRM